MSYFDWSKSDVERAINKAKAEGRKMITLSMEHNSGANEIQVLNWSKELGHEAALEMERCIVTIK